MLSSHIRVTFSFALGIHLVSARFFLQAADPLASSLHFFSLCIHHGYLCNWFVVEILSVTSGDVV